MTSFTDINKIKQLAELLMLDEVRAFEAKQLAQKFAKLSEEHRYDQVVRNVAHVIEQIAKKEPNRLVRAEDVAKIYEQFARLNPESKFREICADLLPKNTVQSGSKKGPDRIAYDNSERDMQSAKKDYQQSKDCVAALDQKVVAFESAIGSMDVAAFKANIQHESSTVNNGHKLIAESLCKLGFKDAKSTFKYGTDNCILYLASFPTTQGMAYINVPVFAQEKNVLEVPQVFADMTGKRAYAFDQDGFKKFFNDIDEIKEDFNLHTANSMRHNMTVDIREKSDVGTTEVDEHDIVETSAKRPPIDVEGVLTNAALENKSKYNVATIKMGKSVVANELTKIGYVKLNVQFAGDMQTGLVYDVNVITPEGVADITVPVQVVEGKVIFPTHFAADDGEVHELKGENLAQVVKTEAEPIKYSASLIEIDYNSLRKIIHTAAFDRKSAIATEALNVIKEKFGMDAYNAAMTDYQAWIEESGQDYSKRCASCKYYRARNSRYATSTQDHCNLLSMPCKKVVRKGGICTRSHVEWDRLRDDSYKGSIMTNNIKLT